MRPLYYPSKKSGICHGCKMKPELILLAGVCTEEADNRKRVRCEEMERGGVGGGEGRERSVPVHLQQNRATDLGETGTAPTYTLQTKTPSNKTLTRK